MTLDSSQPPEELLAQISRDMQPVRPSPLPSRLALRLVPIAALASSAILIAIGVRKDAPELGPLVTWGTSIAQFGLAAIFVWIAARESTPAHRLPKPVAWSALASILPVVVVVAAWTFVESPTLVLPSRSAWIAGVFCGLGSVVAGAALVTQFAWTFRHSLAARPALAGALYGASAGISVNAGWRLACPISAPSHSLGAHGLALLATTLLGAFAADRIAERIRGTADARR